MILCVGPPRTGTMTLHRAFTEAGLNSCHQQVSWEMPPQVISLWRGWIEDRNPLYYVPRGVDAIPDAHLTREKKYDAASYWPTFVPSFLSAYREFNPEAWILLNTRDSKTWVSSLSRWEDLHNRIVKSDLPFLPHGIGGTNNEMFKWINEHNERVRKMFKGDPYFLEIAIEDKETPRKLAKALGRKFPWWGIMNANPE